MRRLIVAVVLFENCYYAYELISIEFATDDSILNKYANHYLNIPRLTSLFYIQFLLYRLLRIQRFSVTEFVGLYIIIFLLIKILRIRQTPHTAPNRYILVFLALGEQKESRANSAWGCTSRNLFNVVFPLTSAFVNLALGKIRNGDIDVEGHVLYGDATHFEHLLTHSFNFILVDTEVDRIVD